MSAPAARASSATWAAMPSIAARTRWARPVPSDMPVSAALACGFQYGAASPASAGTNVTPALSATEPPSRSRSAASVITPMSISQLTAAPTVYTWPSRHHVSSSSMRHAGQPTSPFAERTGRSPVHASRNAPVP